VPRSGGGVSAPDHHGHDPLCPEVFMRRTWRVEVAECAACRLIHAVVMRERTIQASVWQPVLASVIERTTREQYDKGYRDGQAMREGRATS